jgi:hypothetical protein
MLSDAALHSALLEIIELITAKLGTAKVTLIEKAMRTIERSLFMRNYLAKFAQLDLLNCNHG